MSDDTPTDWWGSLGPLWRQRTAQTVEMINLLREFVDPNDLEQATQTQRKQLDEFIWMEPLVVELQKQEDLRHLIPYVAHGVLADATNYL